MRSKTPLLSNICAVLINILDTEGDPIRLLFPIRIPVIILSPEQADIKLTKTFFNVPLSLPKSPPSLNLILNVYCTRMRAERLGGQDTQ